MGMGTSFRIETRHERFWADEVVQLQYRPLVMNEIRAFQATEPKNVVKFHGISVDHILSERELDHLCARVKSKRASFVPGGTPSFLADDW